MLTEIQTLLDFGKITLDVALVIAVYFLWKRNAILEEEHRSLTHDLLDAYKENTKAIAEWVILEKGRRDL